MRKPVEADDVYVVICTEMHRAYGPVVGLDLAIEVSRLLTKEAAKDKVKCVYAPVQYTSFTDHATALMSLGLDKPTNRKDEPGGYL